MEGGGGRCQITSFITPKQRCFGLGHTAMLSHLFQDYPKFKVKHVLDILSRKLSGSRLVSVGRATARRRGVGAGGVLRRRNHVYSSDST